MQYVTVLLYPDPAALHPVEAALAEDDTVHRRAIHVVKSMPDGSLAMLAEIEGDLDRYREIMAAEPTVREFAVSGAETGYCYSRVEATSLTTQLLSHTESESFVVEMPIEYTENGGQRVTIVGREADLVGGALDLPESVDIELLSTGPYRPDAAGVFADLTDRQREVLETALDLGYYETPRQATHEDIADTLDVESATVGKHLRRVEATVFEKYVR
jgi:predicted DNA binding protein